MSDHLDKICKELEGLNTFCKHSNGISLNDYKEISKRISAISKKVNQHQRAMYLAVTEQCNSNNTIKLLIDSMGNYAMTHSELGNGFFMPSFRQKDKWRRSSNGRAFIFRHTT